MTLQNYKELQSYCIDLLVSAGIVEIGKVNTDGSVVMSFTADGNELTDSLTVLLKSAKDNRVRETLISLLDAPDLSNEDAELIALKNLRQKTKIEQNTVSKPESQRY